MQERDLDAINLSVLKPINVVFGITWYYLHTSLKDQVDDRRGEPRDAKQDVKSVVLQVVAHYLADAQDEVSLNIPLLDRKSVQNTEILDPFSAQK